MTTYCTLPTSEAQCVATAGDCKKALFLSVWRIPLSAFIWGSAYQGCSGQQGCDPDSGQPRDEHRLGRK